MNVTIYHNPRCSTSRRTLDHLRDRGIEPRVVNYLRDTPDAAALRALFDELQIPVHAGIRTGEALYTELGLGPDTPEPELIDAIAAHPRLLERPIVVTGKGARIARPDVGVLADIL